MAVVPNDEIATAQQEPLPGRAFPRFSDEANPAEFGYGVGAGLEKAAGDIQKVTNQANELAVTKQHTALLNAANQLQFDPQNGAYTKEGENAINLVGQYGPKLDQTIQQLTQGLSNPAQRQAFSQLAARESVSFNLNLNRHEQEQQRVAATEIYKNSIEADAKNAESHYNDPVLVQQMKDHIKDTAEKLADHLGVNQKDGLPTGYGANIASAYFERIDGNVARGMVDRDPVGTLKDLMQPDGPDNPTLANIKDARMKDELLARAKAGASTKYADMALWAYRTNGQEAGAKAELGIDRDTSINADVKEMIYGKIDAGLAHFQREQQQVYGKDLEQVHESIASGTGNTDTISKIYSLIDKGAIGSSQGGTMIGDIRKQMLKDAGDNAGRDWAITMFKNNRPMDPGDPDVKKYANSAFEEMSKNMVPLSPEWTNLVANGGKYSGIFPSSAISAARTAYVSEDPAQAAKGALALRRWEKINGHAMEFGMSDKDKAIFDKTVDLLEAHQDPEGAIKMGRDLANMNETQRNRGEESWKALGSTQGKRANFSALSDGLSQDSRFAAMPAVPTEVQGQYEAATHVAYIANGGDLKAAQDTAIRGIVRGWGVSEVNGKPQIMQWAPEQMNPGLTKEAIREDIKNLITNLNQPPIEMRGLSKAGTIKPYDTGALDSKPIRYLEEWAGGPVSVIPTVVDGKELSRSDAVQHYLKTGESFGTFTRGDQAQVFLNSMDQAKRTIRDKLPGQIDPDDVKLVPYQGTEYSKGQKWQLAYKDQDGFVKVVQDRRGNDLSYQLPNGKEVAEADRKKAADAGMAKAKALDEQLQWQQQARQSPIYNFEQRLR